MSEPLTSSDIEDVVSSVRRLVSPETRPRILSRDLGLDRLILTPALRIVADQTASGPAVVTLETGAKKARPGTGRSKTRMLRPPILAEDGAEIMPPVAGVAADTATTSLSEMALGAEEAELMPPESAAEAVAVAPKKSARKARVGKGTAGRDKAARPSVAKPLGAGKSPAVRRSRLVVKPLAGAVPDPGAEAEDLIKALSIEPQEMPGMADDSAAPIEVFPESGLEAEEDAGAARPLGLTDGDGNPISLLDEDQLIQLLRRVIREELQGNLGEKITRTVRKLVRAEIARALTAETLE